MKLPFAAAFLSLTAFVAAPALAQQASSPSQGQEAKEVRSLSPDQIDAYLSGKGMGMARAAELNGYPGPAHVLELAPQLNLTTEQRARTEALHSEMSSKAISLGVELVETERKLDRMFAAKAVNREALARALEEIGALQARLRMVHLEAHLAQAGILTPQQAARYAQLRGVAPAAAASAGQAGHSGH